MSVPFDDLQVALDRLDRLPNEEREAAIQVMRGWLATQVEASPIAEGELPSEFGMIGATPAMQQVFKLLGRIMRTDIPVLVLGESGTGKELVASALHNYGPRRKKALVAVNCAAIPANLLESEIFGHIKGSFTGAHKDRKGFADAANGGTLFLDEIGEIEFDLQAKLLRFLQDGEIRPVGANATHKVDVRIVAATNRNLLERVQQGQFREDLYYRLAVMTLELPALRERADDVRHLVKFMLVKQGEDGMPTATISDEAMEAMCAYAWPGNIRQLQNELVRAAAFANDGVIQVADLSEDVQATA
ncbi:MAG: sigma-54-dependent Fis family transcriptional regulator [Planctomycetes bacterium]|nr:sigma-54-dependent Fis family transcriptional regulator [Planctomycetota bacterium]MCP4769964.1 sigma-54-dependent Fis family transcriptional regulator [Planctomycetota bacterium]MCP4859804.1 sigma-54-dependent Fis family transcriptional regulator [Planctomycetota bacterium]